MSTPGTVNFPTTLDDVMSLCEVNNNASATLVSPINNSVLLIPVTQPSEFPNSGFATIVDSLINPTVIEIVRYESKSGSDLVVPVGGRGQQGTAASAFSAGAVVEQRGTARNFTVLADAIRAVQAKLGDGAPIHPLNVAGTNQAGLNQEIAGGKGTGNAEPGEVVIAYPLRGASGTLVQALSAGRFPPVTALFTNTDTGDTVTNTTTETSLFTGMGASVGSTRVIEGGFTKAGTLYRIRVNGDFLTTGTPTFRFRVKLGSTIVVDTQALTSPNNNAGRLLLDIHLHVFSVGAAASVRGHLDGEISQGQNGIVTLTHIKRVDVTAVDLVASQTIDITAQWGAPAAGNQVSAAVITIERIR